MRAKRWGIALSAAVVSLIAAVFLLPESSATFTSAVNASPTVAASATFPGRPKLISDKGPVFYHRMEEPQAPPSTTVVDAMSSSTGAYSSAPTGPSTWWRFDEAAGATSFSDVSGAADTASAGGTVTTGGAGPMGGAVTLGNGSYLTSAGSPFRADRSFTMSVWVNIGTAVPTSTRLAVVSMTGGSISTPNDRSDAMIIAETPANCGSASPCWAFVMAGNPQNTAVAFDSVRSTTPVAASTWVHLTAVFDGTVMSLYVNGSPEGGTKAHTIPASASTNAALSVGRYRDVSWLGGTNGTAQIGETRTWRRNLSATEVTELAVRPTARYAFNEAAGTSTTYTTAVNSTGAPGAVSRSAPLTTSNGAVLSAGREGNAFNSVSAGGYLTGPGAQLVSTNSFTVSAWVKLTDGGIDRTFFSANYGAGTVFSVGYSQFSKRWVMGVLTGLPTVTATADVTAAVLNQWVHLVAAYDKNNNLLRLFVDGVAQSTVSLGIYSPWNSDDVVVVGGKRALGIITEPWPGQVDDLRIYNGYPLNGTPAVTAGAMQTFVNQLNPSLSAQTPGGLQGSTKTGHAGTTAVAFGGTSNGYNNKYAGTSATAAFTVECLIKVAPGQSGVIAGFTSTATTGLGGTSSDRLLYVDTAGKVRFGVLQAGNAVTVASTASVDDGAWHHITAGLGPVTGAGTALAAGGLRLSLDGTVSSNNAVTGAAAANGVWRWGGAPFLPLSTVWTAAPSNPYLTGTIDEFAVYDKQLTDQDDLWRVYGNY
ncbi:LamG domain-containing protein [Actinoplanes sp. TRM 88003]|uniref:LamG domain-containing protein n=1 Tax=Paractinoplanes aksuensis TaxID=2939490 RepID=A0ABT1DFA7_9ACTN|nr:LamG domain-containing protein [Actinoplanes aksuensis]MCO8269508.1 LamG domain-containing protein [Actinoplanes aksuensis]